MIDGRRQIEQTVNRNQRDGAHRIEAASDLKKPAKQLLEDVYAELLSENSFDDKMLHATKRLAALQAKMTINLGRWAVALAILSLIVSIIALVRK